MKQAKVVAIFAVALVAATFSGLALAANVPPHDVSCAPDGLSHVYHKEMSKAKDRMERFEAIFDESERQSTWMNEYLARAAKNAPSKQQAKALMDAQAAWKKWIELDGILLECIDDAVGTTQNLYRFEQKLEELVRRTVMLRHEAMNPNKDGWKFKPPVGDPRDARDNVSRDSEGYSTRFRKAIADWDGNSANFLDIVQAEIELQDKWLNELYKELRAKMANRQKTQLRDAQRAWLAWREADGKYIYATDSGSIARMNANREFLDKLVRRVVFLEIQLWRY